jgi:hypothetical protein
VCCCLFVSLVVNAHSGVLYSGVALIRHSELYIIVCGVWLMVVVRCCVCVYVFLFVCLVVNLHSCVCVCVCVCCIVSLL